MHEDEAAQGAEGSEPQPGAASSRREALLAMLAGSGATYAAPLAASFTMGGLSLPAQAASPPFGNQCFAPNQAPPAGKFYRIDFGAQYTLDGVPSGGFRPAYLLIRFNPDFVVADADGWTAFGDGFFGVEGRVALFLGFGLTLQVSNTSGTFAIVTPPVSIFRGGPMVLARRGIAALTPENPFPAKPIHSAAVTFGEFVIDFTDCGPLRIQRARRLATLSAVDLGGDGLRVPSGALPPATVPSGEL